MEAFKTTFLSAAAKCTDWIYPPRCPVCDDAAPGGTAVCPECFGKLQRVGEDFCLKCGKPIGGHEAEYCRDCMDGKHLFEQGRSLYVYEGDLRASLYRMKYGGRREYAGFYGEQMVRYLGGFIKRTDAQGLVPVPISKKRQKERGYNQAALLAEKIADMTGIPLYEDLVLRVRDTAPQKKLDAIQRQNNLKKAFKIGRNDVKLDRLILIDDIYTTGATVDAVAKVLRQYGSGKVYVLTLAAGKQ